jgi:drug/metabolite transporter (DMT)-like permease
MEVNMKIDENRMLGILGVIAASVLWSTAGFLIKLVNWSPIPIAGIRSLIAAILIFIYLKKPKFTFSKAQITAALAMAATMFLFVTANKMTTAANAILLQFTAPIYVALLSSFILKEKVRRLDWLVIAVVLGGLSLFFLDDMTTGNLIGNLLAILSGFTMAVMIIALRLQKDGSPVESTLLGNCITFVVALPFIATAPMPDMNSIMGLVLLGIFQLGLAYILFANAIKHVTAVEGTLLNVVEPLCNPIWVFLFIGEVPTGNALIGGIIVLTAVTVRSMFR